MQILVIGGTAFIGREIVERLVRRGHKVTVLHRRDHHDLGAAVANLQADRGDIGALHRALNGKRFDAVCDLAYDWQKGTSAAAVEAAARACADGLQRYVFMSSIAAYGPGLDHRESDPLLPAGAGDPYSLNKAAAERALFALHAQSQFPAVTFRPPFVHGPRQPFYREQFFWDRLRDGRPIILPDGGDAAIQLVFAPDLAEACIRALEVPEAAGEAFNFAHVESLTQRTFVEALASVAGVNPRLIPVPRDEILAAGGNVFMGNLYFGEVLDLPPHTEIVEKAPRMLGVQPTPVAPALRATFEWYARQPRRPVDYSFEDRLLGPRL